MVLEQDYDVNLIIQGQGYLLRSLKGKKNAIFSGIRLSMGLYIYIYLNFKNGDSIFFWCFYPKGQKYHEIKTCSRVPEQHPADS